MSKKSLTMNFFESQQKARKKTAVLVLYLFIAYVFVVAVFNLAASAVSWYLLNNDAPGGGGEAFQVWDPLISPWVTSIAIALIAVATVYNMVRLFRGGAKAVVAMLKGRQVVGDTSDLDERKLLNIVEEMAIASGMPVPEVYVIEDEETINAFAAGLTPGNAVLVVTRGCMTALNREQLQGVIGHEFSHILNGDMRLNLRLMASVSGLMVLTTIGLGMMQSADNAGMFVTGAVMASIGSIGALSASVIKSAVSRQREFLADASSVQFTRNPAGIAGALLKIINTGSVVNNYRAAETSHFFFANGVNKSFFGLLATHPPIRERIRCIEPAIAGLPLVDEDPESPVAAALSGDLPVTALSGAGAAPRAMRISAGKAVRSIGAPKRRHLRYAEGLRVALPPALAGAAHSPQSACALIYVLLISPEESVGFRQFQRLKQHADPAVVDVTRSLLPEKTNIQPEHRLPLLDLSMPALKKLSPDGYREFRENIEFLVQADHQVTLFEFMLMSMVKRRLDPLFDKKREPLRRISPDAAAPQCRALLSLLAWEGASDAGAAARAFQLGMAALGPATAALMPREECRMDMVERAFALLAATPFAFQERLIQACILCISADMAVTIEEAELMRAVAESLGCPMPPLLPGLLKTDEDH